MATRERDRRGAGSFTLRVAAIGRCEIHLGRTRIDPDSATLFGLLLYLAVNAGRAVPRRELLDLLWLGNPDRQRRHALRQMLYRIRRAGLRFDDDGRAISVDARSAHVDLGVLLESGWHTAVARKDIPLPQTILPGYDPDLGGEFAAWVEGVREAAASQIRRACLRHIGIGRNEGRWEDVEDMARICIHCDPLNEDATLALAEATAMAGARAEALRILDGYLWEVSAKDSDVSQAAKLLRRRIAAQPRHHVQRTGEPPLIGRAEEIAWLNAHHATVRPGKATAAMLAGLPGIGKTAIVRAFSGNVEMHGWQVAVSRLQSTDGDRSMSVFLDLLPVLLDTRGALGAAPESLTQLRGLLNIQSASEAHPLPQPLEPEVIRARTRSAALDLIGAVTHEGPLLIVLEDLHWIDPSSLRLLAWLVEHSNALPVMWLMTSRMESHFAQLRDIFTADRVPMRVVGPLGPAESVALFTAYVPNGHRNASMEQTVFVATGGNPLYIREVASHWLNTGDHALPRSLRSLMADRIARLSAPSQRVLHCCAVLGRFATVHRVAAVLQVPTVDLLEAVEELNGLGLVGVDGAPGSLALHDLWQEFLLSIVQTTSRALIDLKCGEVLAADLLQEKSTTIALAAARHLTAAGARTRAVNLLCDLAQHHEANGMIEDAITVLDRAVDTTNDFAESLRLAKWRLSLLQILGDWTLALAAIDQIDDLVRNNNLIVERHSDLELVRLEARLSGAYEAREVMDRTRACSADMWVSASHRAKAIRLGARAAANLLDDVALSYYATAAESLDLDDPLVRTHAWATGLIFHTDLGNLKYAMELASNIVALERTSGTRQTLLTALRNATIPLRVLGRFVDARAHALEAYEVATNAGLTSDAAAASEILATIFFEWGELQEAESWLERSEPWVNRVVSSHARSQVNITSAMIALERGDPDIAISAASILPDTAVGSAILRRRLHYYAIALRASIRLGDRAAAQRLLYPLADALKASVRFRRLDYIYASCVLGFAAVGESQLAADHLALLDGRGTAPSPQHVWRETKDLRRLVSGLA